jgi:hypothetical protein
MDGSLSEGRKTKMRLVWSYDVLFDAVMCAVGGVNAEFINKRIGPCAV